MQFQPPPPDDLGVVESVLREPRRATLPLSKLAPEAALRRHVSGVELSAAGGSDAAH